MFCFWLPINKYFAFRNKMELFNRMHGVGIKRSFSVYITLKAKQIPNNLKGKSKSSQEWLTRQMADPYVEKAKMMNYRCRSAFKLLEIDDKYHIIKPGDTVIDCGAAPGSWTQIAVERSNANGNMENKPKGAVFSMDLLHFHAITVRIILKSCVYVCFKILNLVFLGCYHFRRNGFYETRKSITFEKSVSGATNKLCLIRYGTECNWR